MATNTAPIKWAQRHDSLYLTIALRDVKDANITLTDGELKFTGKAQDKDYEVNIEFYENVDAEGSTYKVLPQSIQMHIMKASPKEDEDKDDDEETFWPRLLKDKKKEKNQVKIDWDRYVDEDEEEEGFDMSNLDGGMGMGGMGGMPPGMGGMGGMPGMGGMGGMPGMGGMGGAGGMDMEALMKQMGDLKGAGGLGGLGGEDGDDDDDDDDEDDDDDDLPDLEES